MSGGTSDWDVPNDLGVAKYSSGGRKAHLIITSDVFEERNYE
jgi:hypothetical protein